MSSVSSPEALESLISSSAPVKKKVITFVALALIVLNAGHAFDSIRLAISSAQRMEINSYLIEIQTIRERLEEKYADTRATFSRDDRRAADNFLERVREEDYLDQLKTSSPSLLRVSFG